jgi:hypothetical protein
LWLATLLQQLSARFGWRDRSGRAVAMVTMLTVLMLGVGHAMTSTDEPRRMAADVGHWLRHEFPTTPTVAGPPFMSRIVSYYSHSDSSSYVTLPLDASDASILDLVARNKADVVILWPTKHLSAERCTALVDRLKPAGLTPIGPDILPVATGKVYVLVRAGRLECARRPTPGR